MKNQKGFAVILMVTMVTVMVVSFLGAASVYFGSLYKMINRQQQIVAGYQVMQDFAQMAQRARESALPLVPGDSCPTGTEADPLPTGGNAPSMCWPKVSSGQAHCVPHPLGNTDPNNPRLICRTASGEPQANRSAMDVTLEVVEPPRSLPEVFEERFYALKSDFSVGLDIIASYLQNAAMAQQGSETAHLPSIAGALDTNFTSSLNCSGAITTAMVPYCKRCPAAASPNLGQCFRLRVCLRPGGCDISRDEQWVIQTIGLLNR